MVMVNMIAYNDGRCNIFVCLLAIIDKHNLFSTQILNKKEYNVISSQNLSRRRGRQDCIMTLTFAIDKGHIVLANHK